MILGDLFAFLSEYFWRNYIFQLEGITVGFLILLVVTVLLLNKALLNREPLTRSTFLENEHFQSGCHSTHMCNVALNGD